RKRSLFDRVMQAAAIPPLSSRCRRMEVARNLKVWVDHNACVGNAMCEAIAAKTFRLNGDRQSEVVDPTANTEAEILEAAENCPVSAIFVEDAETGERLFP